MFAGQWMEEEMPRRERSGMEQIEAEGDITIYHAKTKKPGTITTHGWVQVDRLRVTANCQGLSCMVNSVKKAKRW